MISLAAPSAYPHVTAAHSRCGEPSTGLTLHGCPSCGVSRLSFGTLAVGIVLGVVLAGALGWAVAGAPGAPTWMRDPLDAMPYGGMGPMHDDGRHRAMHDQMHGGRGGDPVETGEGEVAIQNTRYQPMTLYVRVGEPVTWTNHDSAEHTVTADDGSWGSDYLLRGQSFTMTFGEPGTYRYHCVPHAWQESNGRWSGQVGTIIVQP